MTISLDHLGFVGPRLEPMREAFTLLGFSATEPRPLMSCDPDTGAAVPLEQWSCHVVLERGYLELSAVASRDAGHHLSTYAAAGNALQICAFGTRDLARSHAQCRDAGVRVNAPQWATREIHYGARRGDARFHWFMVEPADAPEGLLCFVEHGTPELVYQPEVQQHANSARSLTMLGVVLPTRDALATATIRYQRLLGRTPAVGAMRQRVFELGHQRLVLYSADAAAALFGEAAPASAFAIAGIEVADSATAADRLARQNVPFVDRGELLIVPPSAACGAILCLHAPGRVF
ncbi:MAG: VOC family protein [Pseudomonadales bacterium]|jgi:hypothetical protein|nr:VOC family protein [Pseudomonadales bacterium]